MGEGAEVETIDVAHLDYGANGCRACMSCQKSDEFECVIDDEASPILRRLPEADVLVFATPVYFFGPTAQLKLMLDRMFSLVKIDHEAGSVRKATQGVAFALIATAGGGMDDGLGLVEQTFSKAAKFSAKSFDSLLVPNAPQEADLLSQDDALREKASALGKKLAGG